MAGLTVYELYYKDTGHYPLVVLTKDAQRHQLFFNNLKGWDQMRKMSSEFFWTHEWKLVWSGASFDDLVAQPLLLEYTDVLIEHLV